MKDDGSWRQQAQVLTEVALCSRRRRDPGQKAYRPKRVWEVAAAAAAADAAAATAAHKEWQGQYWSRNLYALVEEQEQRRRKGALVLSTRDWIKRAKSNLLSGPDIGVRVGEQSCGLGRQKAEEEEPSVSNVDFLPFQLVFSRLPLRQLFQLRCVCKNWNLMLRGPALAELDVLKTEDQEEYWFVMSQPLPCDERVWNFRAFSSQDWAFFGLPLPGCSQGALSKLLGGIGCSLLPQLEDTFYVGRCRPRLVSAGGLMCAFVHKPEALDEYSVTVFNCLTGWVKVLPRLQDPLHLSRKPGLTTLGCNMHMAVDNQDPARYYILLTHEKYVRDTPGKFYFEVFDSRRGCWRVGQDPKAAIAGSKVLNADFFFRTSGKSLLGYNVSDDVWNKVSVAPISGKSGGFPTFLKYKGRLLQGLWLVGSGNICAGFAVWELRPTASEVASWVEVARTPVHLWEGISHDDWDLNIRAEGSLFYMVFEDQKLQGRFRPPLVYDIAQDRWYSLPSERGSTSFGCISVLRPRLSTMPRGMSRHNFLCRKV
ncbi:hypothetical protein GOP47_0020185 [Adiantum capillus-veneris]|uniref:F-box domain-containing protein n=1 Tax=Adiantum capillus-veneris TaxID=13818 RepID=A0A9D4UCY4_ADICA|nr:hypothetical protein GOP47_0020185 [Adiantum capillus-veneris]